MCLCVSSAGNLRVIYGRGVSHNIVAVSEEHACKRAPLSSLLLCLTLHTPSTYSLLLLSHILPYLKSISVYRDAANHLHVCVAAAKRKCDKVRTTWQQVLLPQPPLLHSCNYRIAQAHTRSRGPLIYGQQRPLTARATSCASIAEAPRCTLQLINVERAACGPN